MLPVQISWWSLLETASVTVTAASSTDCVAATVTGCGRLAGESGDEAVSARLELNKIKLPILDALDSVDRLR